MSLPKIAVNVAPAKVPAAPAPTSGKFSAALAAATDTKQDATKPDAISASGGKNSSVADKGEKGKTKSSGVTTIAFPVEQESDKSSGTAGIPGLSNFVLPLPPISTPQIPVNEPTGDSSSHAATGDLETPAVAIQKSGAVMPAHGAAQSVATTATQVTIVDAALPAPAPEQSEIPEKSKQNSEAMELVAGDKPVAVENLNADDLKSAAHRASGNAEQSSNPSKVTAAIAAPITPAADPKADVRKSAATEFPKDFKPATTTPPITMARPNSDVTRVPIAPPMAVQPGNTNLAVTQVSRPNQSAAGNSDSGIEPPSTKKDGNAAKHTPPSDKAALSAASTTATNKASNGDGSVVAGSVSAVGSARNGTDSSSNNAVQISTQIGEGKATVSEAGGKATNLISQTTNHDAATTMERSGAPEPSLVSPIQVSRLVERAGETEFRVGIQSSELGNVNIRTSMTHSQLSAEISVDRGELGRALSAELPNLHDRLAEQRVPVSNIVLQDHSGQNGSAGFHQGSRHNPYGQAVKGLNRDEAESFSPVIAAAEAAEISTGLDIHM